ncbi:energy-coupling factor transporter transmembrane component T family protein [Paraclostridium sordellii]|uniref:Energy-coupling factor transporter transmembrane protein EcfT n=1 Tax=Paraclostridium sordellii TaxID=1505 RepID=A0A0A1SFD4_PARSO|nr:energy-coupling factor transporter transmembrane component T [Paeniclostridium sordellii]QYE98111.1 energy-coupling factor transporter transmembrane protein EcfT [Paeniclostridium sordellii]CEJ72187.1 ABC-type transport system, cobalt-specific permease [[Clostridium] sordellii] [Paeniclostridium sordellii]CEN21174.1 ABC transporter cobalt-specific permease [[Clostridium] sordellii] [Paeniclostridium sordellii]CEN21503.1 ABC transporter cobalt-specific permease [[Clostridium] sordellii] [Paen
MLKDITIGQYYPTSSIIHKLDARVKLVATFIFMVSLFIINKFWPYLIVVGCLLSVIKLSKIPRKFIVKGLKPLKWIIIFTFIINIFFIPGDPIWSFGFIKITEQGISQAIFMGLRLIFLVVGTSLLTLTTSPIELTDGIERLLKPLRKIGFPVHELAMMMTIALRFIPTLLDETDKIMKAQMSRGADFESKNIINRAKNLVPLLIPLFISAFRRADELAMAMEARCYRGGYNRTKMKEVIMTKADYIAYAIQFIYLGVILVIRFI